MPACSAHLRQHAWHPCWAGCIIILENFPFITRLVQLRLCIIWERIFSKFRTLPITLFHYTLFTRFRKLHIHLKLYCSLRRLIIIFPVIRRLLTANEYTFICFQQPSARQHPPGRGAIQFFSTSERHLILTYYWTIKKYFLTKNMIRGYY